MCREVNWRADVGWLVGGQWGDGGGGGRPGRESIDGLTPPPHEPPSSLCQEGGLTSSSAGR